MWWTSVSTLRPRGWHARACKRGRRFKAKSSLHTMSFCNHKKTHPKKWPGWKNENKNWQGGLLYYRLFKNAVHALSYFLFLAWILLSGKVKHVFLPSNGEKKQQNVDKCFCLHYDNRVWWKACIVLSFCLRFILFLIPKKRQSKTVCGFAPPSKGTHKIWRDKFETPPKKNLFFLFG